MAKALGRCTRRHAQVIEYEDGTMPQGACVWQQKDKAGKLVGEKCGEPLIEWATKNGAATRENGR